MVQALVCDGYVCARVNSCYSKAFGASSTGDPLLEDTILGQHVPCLPELVLPGPSL